MYVCTIQIQYTILSLWSSPTNCCIRLKCIRIHNVFILLLASCCFYFLLQVDITCISSKCNKASVGIIILNLRLVSLQLHNHTRTFKLLLCSLNMDCGWSILLTAFQSILEALGAHAIKGWVAIEATAIGAHSRCGRRGRHVPIATVVLHTWHATRLLPANSNMKTARLTKHYYLKKYIAKTQ